MHSDVTVAALYDIARNIDLAVSFTAGLDYEDFAADSRTVYAVTRCLEIISEAARRLPDELKTRHPTIAWSDMAGAGNVYRHDYEDVLGQQIWDAVQIDLPPLRVVVDQRFGVLGYADLPTDAGAHVFREQGSAAIHRTGHCRLHRSHH